MNATSNTIAFALPEHLACPSPTEKRNLARDEVRLLVTKGSGQVAHSLFRNIGEYLQKGDILVVNTSATRPAALPVALPGGRNGMAHMSTKISSREWLVEIREVKRNKTIRWKEGFGNLAFQLPNGASLTLKNRYYRDRALLHLWTAEFNTKQKPDIYLADHAQPIRYDRLDEPYPLDYYQTYFSFQPGSSEMPSAGRGFTQDLVEKLLSRGIVFAPILLHTGVSSLEENEAPYPEYMEISPLSASIINAAKKQGRRIIAVGTTAVRAIESAVNEGGEVIPYRGNTGLYIDDDYRMKIADALLTGFHEPRASHLKMLQALAGFDHIERAYEAAIEGGYYWHQFGDLHLILP